MTKKKSDTVPCLFCGYSGSPEMVSYTVQAGREHETLYLCGCPDCDRDALDGFKIGKYREIGCGTKGDAIARWNYWNNYALTDIIY